MTRHSSGPGNDAWTLDRLEQLLDRCGADPALWPIVDRPHALGLIEADPAARALADQAARLDRMLADDVEPVAIPDGLRSRILAAAPGPVQAGQGRWRRILADLWPFEAGWQPAGAMVAAAMLGLVLGLSGITAGDTAVDFDSAVDSLVFGPTVLEDSLL